jgi:5-methylcytosine-specific restriction endonuclease McrBC GTP-binding regulatory subunit McrB
LLDSHNGDWKKTGDTLVDDVISIREVTIVEAEQSTIIFTKSATQQKIIFGPPGTGKSYSIHKIIERFSVNNTPENKGVFRTTFHPEYSYGDFVAKLLPLTVMETITINDKDVEKARVEYQIHAGPFIQTLANALAFKDNHFLLVIDEINRGNCAAIFGDIFQLLDRDNNGMSEYPIDPSELTRLALQKALQNIGKSEGEAKKTASGKLFIPSNMSMIATMNTSDESVFYMDSAFKRRWQFQYIGPDDHEEYEEIDGTQTLKVNGECRQQNAVIKYKVSGSEKETTWEVLRKAINGFLLENCASVRRIEDKQLGLWFIKAKSGVIAHEDIQFKLMHYLWDNVFARDKKPLYDKLGLSKDKLVTFGQFSEKCDDFLAKICPLAFQEEAAHPSQANE